ncbi:Growth-regulating factor [Parasponia andersonii]|uniref:Growth-regulating factor n=1 Tax=Parasponia andersonii TaxID=3476 RepID=A0A2P5C8T9_PARAD|nr:Growth-regulating factor [Parasponia andersonii]
METNWSVQEEGSSPVGLNLELGRGSCHKLDNKRCCGFTVLQLHELQLQALIYKYIEAGLPVPYHLVLPIRQSFSTSLGGLDNGLLSHFPNRVGAMCLDPKKGMETEPWRCRRTDGKKWRCSKEALPHQKYCERHVHRGRHRSRKLVESPKYGSNNGASKTTTVVNPSNVSSVSMGSNMTDLSISLSDNKISGRSFLFPRLDLHPKECSP